MKTHMPLWNLTLAIAALTLVPRLPAADTCSAASPATTRHAIVSTFAVPGLDQALTKTLVKELAKVPGVLLAKASPSSGLLAVTHEPAQSSSGKIGEVIQSLAPGSALAATAPAKISAPEGECATCPHRAGCERRGK